MSRILAGIVCFLVCTALPAQAPRKMRGDVAGTHAPIEVSGLSLAQSRLAILYGMLNNKGIKWAYEGEAANSVLARWDYRGGIVIFKIVYDENRIQVLYEGASLDYRCEDLSEGVCYKASGKYFNYMPHLRNAIFKQVRLLSRNQGATP